MSKIFNLNEGQYLSLCKQKISLNAVYILEQLKEKKELEDETYLPHLQFLQRKGYIDNKSNITQYGEELYTSLFEKKEIVANKTARVKDDVFEQWWKIYPSTDHFEINGRVFKGTQKKNLKRAECLKLFNVLCHSQFTAQQIIEATRRHIEIAKELSLKKRDNQLTYIPNSWRYLNEKRFEPFISKEKPEEKKEEFEI